MQKASDGFAIQPSDTVWIENDSNNTKKYRHVFVHNPAAGGTVKMRTLSGAIITVYIAQGEVYLEAALQVFNSTPTPPAGLVGLVESTAADAPLTLKAISAPAAITNKPRGTNFNDLGLPATLSVTITDGVLDQTVVLPVSWHYGNYDSSLATPQIIKGRVALTPKVLNPNNLSASISVTLT